MKEVRNNIAIYSHALPRIHVIGGQRSVRIAPPSLPPHHSSSATRDFQSSISVEVLFHRCHLYVQGLLHQQLLSSAMVQYGGLLPVDRVVVLPLGGDHRTGPWQRTGVVGEGGLAHTDDTCGRALQPRWRTGSAWL